MSFSSGDFRLANQFGNGRFQVFEYETNDPVATVMGSNYFSAIATNFGAKVGDHIEVRHWRDGDCSPLTYVVVNAPGAATAVPKHPGLTFDGADVLADYTRLPWTPAPAFATPGNVSFTVASASGIYRRIGDQVTISANLQFSTNGYATASGLFRVTGLPFPVTAAYTFPLALSNVGKFAVANMAAEAVGGQSYVNFRILTNAAAAASVTTSHVPASTADFTLRLGGTYLVD